MALIPMHLQSFPPHLHLHLNRVVQIKYNFERSLMLRCTCALSKGNDSQESSSMIDDLKKSVLRAVSNTDRGKATTYEQRKSILKLIEMLEKENSILNPVDSPLLSGSWALLYTAPVNEETADKFAGTEEGPFLARIKPLSLGSLKQKSSSQIIDSSSGIVENNAAFSFLDLDGTLSIKGTAVKASVTRLNVTFDGFTVTLGTWTSPMVSLKLINPKGWVETTYLDNDLRVGRGDKGSIFVAARAKKNERAKKIN